MSTVAALILARGGSKRIEKKNIVDFLGRPIISYPIRAAVQSGMVDEVIVSTDDPEILEISKQYGAKEFPLRPAEYCEDTKPMDVPIMYELGNNISADIIVLLYATAVFVTPYILRSAFITFEEENLDHMIAVKKATEKSAYTLLIDKKHHTIDRKFPEEGLKDHSYDNEYHSAEQFEIFKRIRYLKDGDFAGKNGIFEYDPHRVTTINSWEDLAQAELIYKRNQEDKR
jgi:pseudaminic acid cytidylyltransferase